MNAAPSQSQDKFIVRLPDGMRERIKAAADANKRSMNAEIVARLEETFAPPIDLPPEEIQLDDEELVRMDRIMREFAELLANRRSRGLDEPMRLPPKNKLERD